MKRVPFVCLVALLGSACTGGTQSVPAPASTPAATQASSTDPLPSWNEGSTKNAIRDFVARVTKDGSPDFVPAPERIATFDNDGTLWTEKPLPFQLLFALDRAKALAPQHPDWNTKQPFASLLKGDMAGVMASGGKGVLEIMAATHAGMTTDEFAAVVQEWITSAKHPQTGRFYTEMIYQPMVELLAYLRSNGFKTYIASGGGVEFMRGWTERVYGITPEQVVGSTGKLKLDVRDGKPVLIKLPEIDFVDDKEGKPAGIQSRIGRRPIAAFGNSDGDLQMLQWTMAGGGARFAVFVHHDDAAREFAYDRTDKMQQFDKGWDEAVAKGWTVVSMKNDWKQVYPTGSAGAGRSNAQAKLPRVLEVSSVAPEKNAQLSSLIAEIRSQTDAFVFLSGGASRMREDHQQQLLGMFEALALIAKGGRRIAVGDGGTQAGIMEAAGRARRASGNAFPLIGVAPAREIPPRGKTPVDPNHSHVIAVDNPSAPAKDSWGSETGTMYWLFAALAEGRPSVAIVANGGGITLTEVEANIRAGRPIVLIEGSGRAADALVSLLRKTPVSEPELVSLRESAEKARLTQRPELFTVVSLQGGASGLRDALNTAIGGPRTPW